MRYLDSIKDRIDTSTERQGQQVEIASAFRATALSVMPLLNDGKDQAAEAAVLVGQRRTIFALIYGELYEDAINLLARSRAATTPADYAELTELLESHLRIFARLSGDDDETEMEPKLPD